MPMMHRAVNLKECPCILPIAIVNLAGIEPCSVEEEPENNIHMKSFVKLIGEIIVKKKSK